MEKRHAIASLSALAHDQRIDVFRLLVAAEPDGLIAGEISTRLGIRANTLSNNLGILSGAGLIRSVREGRSVRYFADMDGMRDLLGFLMEDCCGGRRELCRPILDTIMRPCEVPMSKTRNVLFLCTGNSARSIMAEAILRREGRGRFQAFSAGSRPRGEIHPFTLQLLERLNHDVSGFYSKSWDEFAAPEAPGMDFVFTVCDRAAAEECPYWPGQPMSAHWGMPDPLMATGNETERRLAFSEAYRMLWNRISIFINLPLASLDRLSLQKRLDEIGRSESA